MYVRPVKDKVLGIVLPGIEDVAEAWRIVENTYSETGTDIPNKKAHI